MWGDGGLGVGAWDGVGDVRHAVCVRRVVWEMRGRWHGGWMDAGVLLVCCWWVVGVCGDDGWVGERLVGALVGGRVDEWTVDG